MTSIGKTLNLDDLQNVEQVLGRTPFGSEILRLAVRLGLIGSPDVVKRRPFNTNISRLDPPKLSDEQSWWTSEFGRYADLHGLLIGQQKILSLDSKKTLAAARSRLRKKAQENGTKMTATEVNDLAEDDPAVRDADERAVVVEMLLALTSTAKEVTGQYLNTISREISFRSAQIQARIY